MKKKFIQSKVQPGAHQDIIKQSDFRQMVKPEHLQFFGTTDCKIMESNFVRNKLYEVGPGSYSLMYANSFKPDSKRAGTAQFSHARREGILLGHNTGPGPQQYYESNSNAISSFTAKSWQTNIGAFGTTQKKFAGQVQHEDMPGPGSYNSQSFIEPKYKHRKIKGQKVKVRGLQQSSFFSSQSTRDIDTNRS